MILTFIKYGGEALALGLIFTAGVFIGKADIKFPVMKRA